MFVEVETTNKKKLKQEVMPEVDSEEEDGGKKRKMVSVGIVLISYSRG